MDGEESSELRQRHHDAPHSAALSHSGGGGGGHGSSRREKTKYKGEDSFIARTLKQYMPKVLNAIFVAEAGVEKAIQLSKHVTKYYDLAYEKLRPYNPEAITTMATGLVLAFFGGWFIVTVAMMHAFRQGGSDRLWQNIELLREEIRNVKEASEKDDKVDDDGDGVADVLQISSEELAQRKLIVALKAMDPLVVQEALGALWTATISAAASVKLQFARTITLGVTIGNVLNRPTQRFVVPVVEALTPVDYHKWYPTVFGYICRCIGASIAFQIQRILSTVSTAMHGGHMMIDGFADFCETRGLTYLSEGYMDDVVAWILVFLGVYVQLFIFTYLPFILKLVLFPFFFVETMLTTLVTTV